MKMTVIGCGHLGATHAACMAEIGHEVVGVDIDEGKVALLNSGRGWFHEPDLDPMLAANIAAGRLRFTTEFAAAGAFADVHFIGVATPGRKDGSYDLSQVTSALTALAPHLGRNTLIIGKSTVAPGTAASLQAMVDGMLRPEQDHAEITWNPEFLREGCAVADTLRPDRIVVGAVSEAAAETVAEIYQPLTDAGVPLLRTDLATAELAKGAANAFLATKISFINAMADICAATGGDIVALSRSLGLDPRIGEAFLKAGIGYGGACLPKDVRGLGMFAEEVRATSAMTLLSAVDTVNAGRIAQVIGLLRNAIAGIDGKRIAVWGAAFKAGTDDVRDSAALSLAEQLRALGASVTVYDPMARGNALVALPEVGYADSALSAAAGADAIVVATAWREFSEVDATEAARVTHGTVIVDACQGVALPAWREAGWQTVSLTGVAPGGHDSRSASHGDSMSAAVIA
jgi:UDPglucose 6-dehydrogenase